MFIQMKTITVTEGNSDQVVNRFDGEGIIEKQDGFIDLTVMVKKVRRGNEEVVVMIRWESEEYWKKWEKSEAHIAGHKANLGKPKPEYIVNSDGGLYDIKLVKQVAEQSI
ncbi:MULTISPECIES: antibiotic biosynthesis monooxygenase [Metabacillus]|jgi:heme oxygenase (staphylobilin-producing)|uniref:Antibiotic biosynthesis monooxygenase n=1 Tax=Metabacillus rhizolycopersici TaxID=2875709 RepID=A0ABS7UMA9_9BACI|nr:MULTISPECIES: antibiotic biosynthesis monooxygenase [Metabacillus]MBZ5749306.1 antibiotic biosynthesis monooxygenase [Metabacillus rhizolycopersici]MCM3651923.1 antibiotic biosynthesis monooxygenase [Metabacillus litoralis]